MIVDTTVQGKAIAYPTDSRLLEVICETVARLAKRAGMWLKQTCERKSKTLRWCGRTRCARTSATSWLRNSWR